MAGIQGLYKPAMARCFNAHQIINYTIVVVHDRTET
jgi:hypothetical protein